MKQSPSPRGTFNTGIYCRGTLNTPFTCALPFSEKYRKVSYGWEYQETRPLPGLTLSQVCSRRGCRTLAAKPAYPLGYKAKRIPLETLVKYSQSKRCIFHSDPLYSFLCSTHVFASVPSSVVSFLAVSTAQSSLLLFLPLHPLATNDRNASH